MVYEFPRRRAVVVGDKVFLRACHAGEPGTVVREQRGRVTVYWPDMDVSSRHRPESLEVAPVDGPGPNFQPPAAA